MNFLFLIFFLFEGAFIYDTHGKLPVVCKVVFDNKNYDDLKVSLLKNNQEHIIFEKKKMFKHDLDLNSNYIFIFSKPGYNSKKINFNTHVPLHKNAFIFEPFEFEITLLKQNLNEQDSLNPGQFTGKIKYSIDIDDFDYSK